MKTLAVIGDPIKHSLSPIMHNAALKNLNLENTYLYKTIHVKSLYLNDFIKDVKRSDDIKGFNVTLPHKSSIIPFLDEIDNSAKRVNAVNTVVNKNGLLIGYNTDIQGFINSLIQNKVLIQNKDILLLGAGGSAYSVAYGLLKEGARVYIKNRSKENAKKLVLMMKKFGNIEIIEVCNFSKIDYIVNTTSVGMDGKSSPIKTNNITENHVVIDIIYNPSLTPLLKQSNSKGAKILNGIDMLIYQGALAFKYFTSQEPDINIMRNSLRKYL